MTYPQTPNFNAPAPDAFNVPAWWTYTRAANVVNVCQSTGASVVAAIRRALGMAPGTAWDDAMHAELTNRVLQIATTQPGTNWGPVAVELTTAGERRQVSPLSLQFGLWYAFYRERGLRLDAVAVPPGSVLPAWGVPLSDGGMPAGQIVCFDPARDPLPGTLTDAQLAEASAQSSTGIRLRPGESATTFPLAPSPGPFGLSNDQIVLVVLGGLAGVAAIVGLMQARRRGRSRARRRRR